MGEHEPKSRYIEKNPELQNLRKKAKESVEFQISLQPDIVVDIWANFRVLHTDPKSGKESEYFPGLFGILKKMENTIDNNPDYSKPSWTISLNENEILTLAKTANLLETKHQHFRSSRGLPFKPIYYKNVRSVIDSFVTSGGKFSETTKDQLEQLGL